jgi:hypothetical protein
MKASNEWITYTNPIQTANDWELHWAYIAAMQNTTSDELLGMLHGMAILQAAGGVSNFVVGLKNYIAEYQSANFASITTGRTAVIGRMEDIDDINDIGPNEYRIADLLPEQATPKANWKQNSGVLRSIMNNGAPIRDASPFNAKADSKLGIGTETGKGNANTFLHMERNLLYDRGWRYVDGYWISP